MVVSWSSGPVDISPYITILLKESRFTGSPHLHHNIAAYLITHSHYAICILPLLLYISLSEVCILDPMCEYIPRQFGGLYIRLKLISGTINCSNGIVSFDRLHSLYIVIVGYRHYVATALCGMGKALHSGLLLSACFYTQMQNSCLLKL